MDQLRSIRDGYSEAVLYGGSMGGYGALIFSGALNATRVVASTPQFSPDPSKPPHETRWQDQVRDLHFRHDDLLSMASSKAEKYIIFDPSCRADRKHVELIAQLPNVRPIWLPLTDHYGITFLHESGVLRAVLAALFFEKDPGRTVRRLRRDGRRSSATYLTELARRLASRGHMRDAFKAVSRAYVLGGASVIASNAFLAVLMADREQYDGLIHVLLRFLQTQQPSWTHYDHLRETAWIDLQRRSGLLDSGT